MPGVPWWPAVAAPLCPPSPGPHTPTPPTFRAQLFLVFKDFPQHVKVTRQWGGREETEGKAQREHLERAGEDGKVGRRLRIHNNGHMETIRRHIPGKPMQWKTEHSSREASRERGRRQGQRSKRPPSSAASGHGLIRLHRTRLT